MTKLKQNAHLAIIRSCSWRNWGNKHTNEIWIDCSVAGRIRKRHTKFRVAGLEIAGIEEIGVAEETTEPHSDYDG